MISTVGIVTGIIVLILTPLVVLYLPIWTSVAAVGAVVLLVTVGGEVLLFKALAIAVAIAIGGVLWRRWRERQAAPPPQPAKRRAA